MSIKRQLVDSTFNDVINSDFNPDIVHIGMLDSYDQGRTVGLIVGGLSMGLIVFIYQKAKNYIVSKKENNKKSDFAETFDYDTFKPES